MEQTLIGHLRYARIYLMQGNHFGQVQAVLDLVTMTERNSPSGQKQSHFVRKESNPWTLNLGV